MSTPTDNLTPAQIEILRLGELVRVNSTPPPADKMTTEEMQALYTVIGFAAPYVVVRRKSDNVKGTLQFTHSPRFYFGFDPA